MEKFSELIKSSKHLIVPSYQRAFAWKEQQVEQFIFDLLEMREKDYYYGHFIIEDTNGRFEIIDGQQRVTTFILFLIVCKLFKSNNNAYEFINKFETVDYDQNAFSNISNLTIDDIKVLREFNTISLNRIFDALKYFIRKFEDKSLNIECIDNYINTLMNAHISAHITYDKAVAVQIFELQNTRGINLNLIEKVKAKLINSA